MENIVFIIALVLSMTLPLYVPRVFIKIHARKNEAQRNESSAADEPLLNQ